MLCASSRARSRLEPMWSLPEAAPGGSPVGLAVLDECFLMGAPSRIYRCLSRVWPTAKAQRIQRTVLNAKEVPPNAKIVTFFDTIEPRIWLPVGVNKSELGSDCAEGGKGVTGLSDCYNQHRRSALL